MCEISGVSEYSAKNIFIRIFFGGSIEEWRKYNNISIETTLLPFVYDLEKEIAKIQANFLKQWQQYSICKCGKIQERKRKI